LEKKALSAIENYNVDMVIANELHTNKFKVIIYEKGVEKPFEINVDPEAVQQGLVDIEWFIIQHIVERMGKFYDQQK